MKPARQKLQSAMEYLMTYGWSILIVAVVLGALAYLGVFNPLYFAPKANPGSCQVFRPNGAGTSYDINLLGVCNGEIPQYVMSINEPLIGGVQAYVEAKMPPNLEIAPDSNLTISAWVDIVKNNLGIANEMPPEIGYDSSYQEGEIRASYYDIQMVRGGQQDMYFSYSTGKWYNFIGTYSSNSVSNTVTLYVDGDLYGSGSTSGMEATGNVIIGSYLNVNAVTTMYISNVQIYNASLGTNSIKALYDEGIGGAPIDLQNLVGWWPLNGNANDYSGNWNNGVPTNVVYTSSWISSYNPP